MPVYGFERDIAMRLKKQAKLKSSGGVGGRATLLPKRGGKANFYQFTLLEDMGDGGLSEIRTMDDSTQIAASAPVVNTLGDFTHLNDGDQGICVLVDGEYYAIHPMQRIQLRVDGLNFQISYDGGSSWTTWASGEECP
jgi:hypothetical protein